MRQQLQWYAAWVIAALLRVGEDFDVDLLQWPGGSLIATGLWAGAKARVAVRSVARLRGTWRKARAVKRRPLPSALRLCWRCR